MPYRHINSWRAIFWLISGLDVIPFAGVFFLAKHRREADEHNDRRIDWIGGTLFTAGAVFFFFCLSQALSELKGFRTPCKYLHSRAQAALRLTHSVRYYRFARCQLPVVGLRSRMGPPLGKENPVPADHAHQHCHATPLSCGGRLFCGGE